MTQSDDIETAIFSYLQTRTGLTALVGTRIYKNRIPEGAPVPHVHYQRLAAIREPTLTGPLGGCSAHYDFNIFAKSAASMDAIRIQLRKALNGYSGTSSDVIIQSVWVNNDWDQYDEAAALYRAVMEVEFDFLETT
jgi:hypothetical protein